jgi:Tol biopolymer transport system component
MRIYVMNADGSAVTRLTLSGANDDYPRWSPNGSKILFQSDRDNPSTGYMDIYVMNADGSGITRLTSDANDDSTATWSPDGSKIVFQSMRNGLIYQVCSMNIDGSNQVSLSASLSNDSEPAWSPDGTKIAFGSDRDHVGFKNLYVVNSNGSGQQRLTFSSGEVQDTQPMWSPDASRIAFVSTRDSVLETWQETDDDGNYITKSTLHVNKEVYVMNADGSGQTRLTNELANDDSPSWTPDGSKIIFRSDRERDGSDPSSQVWVMNPDGTGQTDLSPTNDGDYSANWVLGWTAGDGGTDVSPDATAHSVTINFDTQPQGAVIFDQYQSAIFSATGFSSPPGGCGSVVMGVTGERFSSFPNGIRTGV